jgi:hypothetical protein
MAVTFVEIEDRYQPKTKTLPLEAQVVIGDGQHGAYLIFLDQELKGNNASAVLGNATAVKDKRTIVSATVVDTLEETNWTSITVIIKEGENETVYGPYSKEVAENMDTVCFIIKILNNGAPASRGIKIKKRK